MMRYTAKVCEDEVEHSNTTDNDQQESEQIDFMNQQRQQFKQNTKSRLVATDPEDQPSPDLAHPEDQPAGFSAYSMLFHSSDEGKRKTLEMLEAYQKEKAEKELANKLKKQAKRMLELKKNKEKCKGIFIVRTLEPNKCNQAALQVSKEFLVQSDVLEFNRSR